MKVVLLFISLSFSLTVTVIASETEPLAKDLAGVEPRTFDDWDWAVGGKYTDHIQPESYNSNGLGLDAYQIKVKKLNDTLGINDRQLGDVQRTTRRLPFAEF
ncbi:hypothetical protein [cyanobacterium endosymbiont of Epithemia turgida]|uniref:hypothetical protein n=1 Tax=cyanobacterium endosymbiont of Epithemia turgida TaxID=718217 RepID=UPI0004D1B844|nr:hypothetical protein [cyanobacterium endosymbiont of Epithemia turgida]BAP17124.1 hypothetical protein ETSB_0241 [cyanobacterium endosymbiont of Epithemia turgida isolate EtSB Lake Yunoko]